MTNEEIIQAIRNEIERRKKALHSTLFNDEYNDFLSFLSTLESEKPMSLEEEINHTYHDGSVVDTSDIDHVTYENIAEYFYDLGCRRTAEKYDEIEYNRQSAEDGVPNDLEEAAIQYATHKKKSEEKEMETELPMGAYYLAKDSFTAGARWQENKDHETIKLAEDHAFLAGADWQKEHTPLPEDTVLFNKGVDEGRRLESEENKDRDIVFWRGIQYAKEQMLKDGLDAVKTLDFNKAEKTIAGVFVKYGMDLQKEQIMKEAIHYVVQDDLDSHGASYNIPFIRLGTVALKPKGIGVGDKVCIIIVKEN